MNEERSTNLSNLCDKYLILNKDLKEYISNVYIIVISISRNGLLKS